MKTTTRAGESLKSDDEIIFPLVSGKLKSGAFVPSGSIVELVATIMQNVEHREQLVESKLGEFEARQAERARVGGLPIEPF